MKKIQSFLVIICILCTSIWISNCQSIVQPHQPWKQIDISLETLPVLKTEKRKTQISDDFQKKHTVVMDKNGELYFAKKAELVVEKEILKVTEEITRYSSHRFIGDSVKQEFFPNTLLNPETFIGGILSATLPMELFQVQQESVKVNYQDQMYSVVQGGQPIITGTMIAYLAPWVLTTQHLMNHQEGDWEYTVLNTETKYSTSITLPGLIQSVKKIDNHLLLGVVDQTFFRTSQWVFLTDENRVVSLGSSYAEVFMIGQSPESNWCIVSDWYNRELSVRNRSTFEILYTLPLDKYMISGITSFQDSRKNWHVWIIPVLTVEKFTSNVFWLSLKKNKMEIRNLDFHEPFLVSSYQLDSAGNLYMIEEKIFNQEWDIATQTWTINEKNVLKQETSILKIDPWNKQVQQLPIVWDAETKLDKELVLLNPNIEMTPEGIIIREFSNPYYMETLSRKNYWDYQAGIVYREKIVKKTKKETVQVLDPMTLKPLEKEVPVSDIIHGLFWEEFLQRGIQVSLLIPYSAFEDSSQIVNDDDDDA